MAEATFAKTFLTTLDSRPVKLSPDHVEDARSFPARAPYILPRMPTEMSRPLNNAAAGGTGATTTTAAPGQERSITVSLRSLRNPPLDIKLAAQPLSTSLLDVKRAVAERARIPVDKIKILHSKRPVQDSKILGDIVAAAAGSGGGVVVEFTVMVIGGAAAVLPDKGGTTTTTTTGTAAQGGGGGRSTARGVAAVEAPQFWTDLHGFLLQRVKDENTATEMATLFRNAWESHKAKP